MSGLHRFSIPDDDERAPKGLASLCRALVSTDSDLYRLGCVVGGVEVFPANTSRTAWTVVSPARSGGVDVFRSWFHRASSPGAHCGPASGEWQWSSQWPWGGPSVRSLCVCSHDLRLAPDVSDPPFFILRICEGVPPCGYSDEHRWIARRVGAIRSLAGMDEVQAETAPPPADPGPLARFYSAGEERRALAALLCLVAWRMMEEMAGGR